MRRALLFTSLLSFVFAAAACTLFAPRSVARADVRKSGGGLGSSAFPDDKPLVPYDLKTPADGTRAIREYYTKYEYRVPMRDGVHLFTTAYVPKDASPTRRYPILMVRTPYGVDPYGEDHYPTPGEAGAIRHIAASTVLLKDGFVFVQQDVRGRLMSEGTFVDVRPHATGKGPTAIDESTDAWDTIDWLVKNVPNNNGRVGIWGISYPGFYAAQAAVDAHPALVAVSPQAPVTEWFLGDDFHHNGALFVAAAFDFYSSFGKARPQPTKKSTWGFDYDTADAYDFFLAMGPLANADAKYLHGEISFWHEVLAHETRDAFWKARDPRPHYANARPAILTVGGWYDAEDLWGTLATYRAWETQSPKNAENTIVIGPWSHGGWGRNDGDHLGAVTFGAKTSLFFREEIEAPFFERHLKGRSRPAPPEAWVFETGTDEWQRYASWPPPGVKKAALWLGDKGKLGAAPPAAGTSGDAADAYVSDPAKPVPYRVVPSSTIDEDYMTDDQRFASHRPDVVVYRTSALAADVTIAGPLTANLWVSTTGTDSDFVVKVVDVYPQDLPDPDPNPTGAKMAGYEQLVRAEVMRGKFRSSYETPTPFVPGEPTNVRFTLPDVDHTFRAGHRIMVQVQSSWFPLVDRNPQTFVDIPHAKEADFRAATNKIFRAPGRASSIELNVLRGALPQ